MTLMQESDSVYKQKVFDLNAKFGVLVFSSEAEEAGLPSNKGTLLHGD